MMEQGGLSWRLRESCRCNSFESSLRLRTQTRDAGEDVQADTRSDETGAREVQYFPLIASMAS